MKAIRWWITYLHRVASWGSLMYPLRHSHLKPPSLLMQSCEQVPGIAHSSTSKLAKINKGLDFLPNLNFSQLYFWIGNETKRKRNLKRSEDGERKKKVVFLEFCACAKSKSCRQFSPTKKAEEKKNFGNFAYGNKNLTFASCVSHELIAFFTGTFVANG